VTTDATAVPPFEVRNLAKRYGEVVALENVSLQMEPGEVLGLLGPNGAGKTTLISILTTLEIPTRGEAYLFNEPISPGNRMIKRKLGFVPQETVSHGFFSVEEVLQFHSGYYGVRDNGEHIHFLLERLGLAPHRHKRVRQLSGGMKRRLLIAKALVHKPKLLLLDEPTAGVDIELRTSLWEFVMELNRQGTSILLTTHYLEEAEQLCDRVGIIHHGKILRIGETRGLVRELTTKELTLSFKNGEERHYRVANTTTLSGLIQQQGLSLGDVLDVKVREGKLEDAFKQMVGEKLNA